jgi:four helix bundle protein
MKLSSGRIFTVASATAATLQLPFIQKGFLRSGTSIGANTEESIGGQTDRDFLAKLSIAYKEARETKYWIKLFFTTGYITKEQTDSL